jgi:uncharacterized protein (TIGR03437 family)
MERKTKITIAKTAVVLGVIPLLLWAYEYGPNPGYCGVPNENGTCTAVGCHTGTTNDPANKGSVSITFPNGMTYTPGVAQQLTVTIADPASTQSAWGFQATPRVVGNTATMAGTMTPLDQKTLLMCSTSTLEFFWPVCMTGADTGSPEPCIQHQAVPACPATNDGQSLPLQYIEHSEYGYMHTMGLGSGTYQFTWTPPATNVGNITFYIAGNAGVGGPPNQNGDHIYATSYTLTPAVSGAPPSILKVISASSFGAFTSVAPGSWMEIYAAQNSGSLGSGGSWQASNFNGNQAPTTLYGTSVTIGGQNAFVSYVSSGQVNAQVPSNVGTGSQPVIVTANNVASAPFSINVNALEPGLLAPASFMLNSKQYVVAQHANGDFVLPAGVLSGYTTSPASPGETITIYGVGFGPALNSSNQTIPAGQIATGTSTLVNQVQMQVAGAAATLSYQGLAPSLVGAYQFNLVVPSGAAGDSLLTFTQNGTPSTQTMYLSVAQ